MKPLLIVNADVPVIPRHIRLSDYRRVIYTQDTGSPAADTDSCRQLSYPVSTIEKRAFQLANHHLKTYSLPKDEHDAVVKNLIQFRGIFFYIAVIDFILSKEKPDHPVHILSCLRKSDLQTILPQYRQVIEKNLKANNSILKKELAKSLAIGLANRITRIFSRRRKPVNTHIFLAPTLTAWKMLELLWNKNKGINVLFRDNILNKRKRDFAGYLNKKGIPFSRLKDYPGIGSSFIVTSQTWFGTPAISTLVSFYRQEFNRKVRLWKSYLADTPIRHIVMLEEFLDTANVLNQLKTSMNPELKTYNFMHGAGYYQGISPVTTFAVFGEFYRKVYARMGNDAGSIEIVENPQFRLLADDRQAVPPEWLKITGGKPVITYFSQYTRGPSTVAIRLQIEKWLADYCQKHDCQAVIKLHPAETDSIYSLPEIMVLKDEFPLAAFFHGSMATVTFYSFTAIESIYSGCPVVIANPKQISGLYVFDELQTLQVSDYQAFAAVLETIRVSEASAAAVLEEQQQLAGKLFYREPGGGSEDHYRRIIGLEKTSATTRQPRP
ncbi:MAG: hypothetical protein DRH04_03075 [Deltaproteobacteria bacterium]|nr:MAG: hypothetical protein DRH04_03075 [Deltaproteobacteria bacterium]